ncbi:MAG: dihydropteroate synthase [Lachnospiraceae bacterium]|nr:dihydropteroate synthase [Lachnospiraceae bacterium]
MYIGNKCFDTDNRTYVMGILNVTPDSFSDGGRFISPDAALRRAEEMIAEGADILDIGGESTRPGYEPVSAEEEILRTAPVIKAIKSRWDIPVSIDTQKSAVASAALDAGADLVNDIWGLMKDPEMGRIIAESGAACCLMHNRTAAEYADFKKDYAADMAAIVKKAESCGIAKDRIILDPGVGFGKTFEHNLEVLRDLGAFAVNGYPMLLGASRKSVIGLATGLPKDQRLEGTLVTTVLAVQAGYAFVRVHDIKENVRAIRMAEAILHKG